MKLMKIMQKRGFDNVRPPLRGWWNIQAPSRFALFLKCSRYGNKLSVFLILSASPFLAYAQAYICGSGPGPGERQVGMTQGSNGVASMPLCVSQSGRSQTQIPQFDPSLRIPESLVMRGLELRALERQRSQEKLDNLINEGSWNVYQEGEPPIPGQKCNAAWVSTSGVITIGTTGGLNDPALLIYTNNKIPNSKNPMPENFHIKQNGKERDVQGMRYTFPKNTEGSIIFNLRSLNAVIGDMKDSGRVQVNLDGKELIDISWKDGLEMKKKLAQCAKS